MQTSQPHQSKARSLPAPSSSTFCRLHVPCLHFITLKPSAAGLLDNPREGISGTQWLVAQDLPLNLLLDLGSIWAKNAFSSLSKGSLYNKSIGMWDLELKTNIISIHPRTHNLWKALCPIVMKGRAGMVVRAWALGSAVSTLPLSFCDLGLVVSPLWASNYRTVKMNRYLP